MQVRKDLNFVTEEVSDKRRFLVRFQDGCEQDMTSIQLTVMTVDRIHVTGECDVPSIYTKPKETFDLEKG